MTNAEAIDILRQKYRTVSQCLTADECRENNEAIRLAIAALERDEWISAVEPPDNERDVLVTAFWHEKWQTLMGWYDGEWHVTANDKLREGLSVASWREKPLPEPPKEET